MPVTPSPDIPTIPLEALQTGERGAVLSLHGPEDGVNRLREMGLRVGAPVRMLRPGPPHLLQIGDIRLCVRPAADVLVMIGLDPVTV